MRLSWPHTPRPAKFPTFLLKVFQNNCPPTVSALFSTKTFFEYDLPYIIALSAEWTDMASSGTGRRDSKKRLMLFVSGSEKAEPPRYVSLQGSWEMPVTGRGDRFRKF